ncbi:MAG: class II aldolase/adducin family protein [Candidatus Omnitrophota bacterium]
MFFGREKELKEEIIYIGKRLYQMRLVVGRAGNLSAKLDQDNILVTSTGASLSDLKNYDIIKVNLNRPQDLANSRLTSEFPLHHLVYKSFPDNKVIVHCHPALINAYFALYSDIKALTFETKLSLGNIPVIEQDTPAVSRPELVIEALKCNNQVVLKNHGVVSIAQNFKDALSLIETLEEAVKVVAVARIFKKGILDELDKELKETLGSDNIYTMFSKEHIQAIVDLVNKDEYIRNKGKELDLTLELAIKIDGADNAFKFSFEKGEIKKLDFNDNAPFIISAPADIWKLVFLGKLDPFVAVMQGKMKLKGELGKLSRWYVPFSKLFALFKEVSIK